MMAHVIISSGRSNSLGYLAAWVMMGFCFLPLSGAQVAAP
jgi:hypothetical protein